MASILRRTLLVGTLLIIGTVFGPLLIAVGGAAIVANQGEHDLERSNEAWALVEAYGNELRPGRLYLTIIPPPDGEECGYDPSVLFPAGWDDIAKSHDERSFTDYVGYYVLDHWRSETRDAEYLSAIAQRIDDDLSDFEIAFLRRCISSTLFSSVCMERISGFNDGVERYDHDRKASPLLGWGIEDEIVCTYADGVAARRGIPLKTPE
ncbi:MAG: hypothetical protein QNJ15_15185 [Erythrobacter sp.]|nr:hypothetical protein [Erythrobacter sp.]